MNIRLWIENIDGEVLDDLGTCMTDNVGRALDMYQEELEAWANKGHACVIEWEEIA